jgi:hypothetical protein
MWLKAQNEMEGLWPHAATGPVERMVRPHWFLLGCEVTLDFESLARCCSTIKTAHNLDYYFVFGLRMMVRWYQASFMLVKNWFVISYPDLSPMTDSPPHRGQRAVSELTASALSRLLMSNPVKATISDGGKVCMQ